LPTVASGHRIPSLPAVVRRAAWQKMLCLALWLGHEDPATTHQYIESDLAMKEAALRRVDAPTAHPVRFKAHDRLLTFLEAL
jgi:integrase/recombinase XerD